MFINIKPSTFDVVCFFSSSSDEEELPPPKYSAAIRGMTTSATDSDLNTKLKQRNLQAILHSDNEDEASMPSVRPNSTSAFFAPTAPANNGSIKEGEVGTSYTFSVKRQKLIIVASYS